MNQTLHRILIFGALLAFCPLHSYARLQTQRSVLPNGIVLISSEQRSLPMVTLHLLIDAGSVHDFKGRDGLANLTAALLTSGTRNRNAVQISEALDFIGASLSAKSEDEFATVNLTVLKKDLDAGLGLLADILTSPAFPREEIDRQKQAVIASIRARNEDPSEVVAKKFRESLYPQSPYGRPVEGTEESLRGIDRSMLLDFYDKFYRPNRSILAVVGDVSQQEITEAFNKAFPSWKKGGAPAKEIAAPSPGAANFLRLQKNITQANIVIGHEGVPRGNADYYAIQVMNYILGGGGFSSRLMDSVRNERGLAYSVYSQFDAGKFAGTFEIAMQTRNETAYEALQIAIDEVRSIREKGVSQDELKAAKDFLIGSFPLRIDTNRKIAAFLAQLEFLGLELDYPDKYAEMVRKVTREDVQRVAKRYLKPSQLIVVLLAHLEKADPRK